VLPILIGAFSNCGGWVLDRKTISPTTLQFRIEIQLHSVIDLYAAIIAAGVELTHAAHLILTGLCTCRQHPDSPIQLNQVVALRIDVSFLEDVTLHSLLASANPHA
jgi:hypothetical protein